MAPRCAVAQAAKCFSHHASDREGWKLDVSNGVGSIHNPVYAVLRQIGKCQMLVEKQPFP